MAEDPRNPYGFKFQDTYTEREPPPRTYFDRIGIVVTEHSQRYPNAGITLWTVSGVGIVKHPTFFRQIDGTVSRHCFLFFANPTPVIAASEDTIAATPPALPPPPQRRRRTNVPPPTSGRGSSWRHAEDLCLKAFIAVNVHGSQSPDAIAALFCADNAVAGIYYYKSCRRQPKPGYWFARADAEAAEADLRRIEGFQHQLLPEHFDRLCAYYNQRFEDRIKPYRRYGEPQFSSSTVKVGDCVRGYTTKWARVIVVRPTSVRVRWAIDPDDHVFTMWYREIAELRAADSAYSIWARRVTNAQQRKKRI
jgi:hypothetical protein